MVGVSRPIVKHSFLVRLASEIPETIKKAFYIATSGRPGPVVVDIPKDVTDPTNLFDYSYPETVTIRSYSPATRGHTGQIKKAIRLLAKCERPMIYAGGGVVQEEARGAARAALLTHATIARPRAVGRRGAGADAPLGAAPSFTAGDTTCSGAPACPGLPLPFRLPLWA